MGALFVPIYTGRIYGPYIQVVCTGHPYIRAVHKDRIYGPYIWVVSIGLYFQAR